MAQSEMYTYYSYEEMLKHFSLAYVNLWELHAMVSDVYPVRCGFLSNKISI